MASLEKPRAAAAAAPTTCRAVLSARVWRDLRRARTLGDDGRGGSLVLHGVQINFAHKQQGIDHQQAQHAQRQDDAARAARQVGGDGQQQQQQHGDNSRQRRQRQRMETYAKAMQHLLRLAFRRWKAAISIKSDDETMDDGKQQQQQQQQQAPNGAGGGGGSSGGGTAQLETSSGVAALQAQLERVEDDTQRQGSVTIRKDGRLQLELRTDELGQLLQLAAKEGRALLIVQLPQLAPTTAPSTAMDDSEAAAGAPKRAHVTPPRPAAPAAGGTGGETPPAHPKKLRGHDGTAAITLPASMADAAEAERRRLNEASETLAERSSSRGEGEGSRDGGGPSA